MRFRLAQCRVFSVRSVLRRHRLKACFADATPRDMRYQCEQTQAGDGLGVNAGDELTISYIAKPWCDMAKAARRPREERRRAYIYICIYHCFISLRYLVCLYLFVTIVVCYWHAGVHADAQTRGPERCQGGMTPQNQSLRTLYTPVS